MAAGRESIAVSVQQPEPSLGFLIHEVARLMRRDLDSRVQKLGLTQAQWRTLAYLSRNEGINQAGLAELLEVRPMTLTRLLDRLQSAGWVERRPDPVDRRVLRLHLTEQAGPLIKRMTILAGETREHALRGLDADCRRQLLQTLTELKRNLLCAGAETGAGADEADAHE